MVEKAYFNIDTSNEFYEGYHNPNIRWNGWAMPYFVKEIADIIIQKISVPKDLEISYDDKNDNYIAKVYADGKVDEINIFKKSIIDTPDGKKEVYAIGSGYWVWDSFHLEQAEKYSYAKVISPNKDNTIDYDY